MRSGAFEVQISDYVDVPVSIINLGLVVGYGLIGLYAFMRFKRHLRSSGEAGLSTLLEMEFTVRGAAMVCALVVLWPLWWTLPAMFLSFGQLRKSISITAGEA